MDEGKIRSRDRRLGLFLGLLLAGLAAAIWAGSERVVFGPFQLGLYDSPDETRTAGAAWHARGALILGPAAGGLQARAWAPSFSVAIEGVLRAPVRLEIRNVLPAAEAVLPPGLAESRRGTVRVVDLPAGSGPAVLTWGSSPRGPFSFAVTGDTQSEFDRLPAMVADVDFLVIVGDVVARDGELPPFVARLSELPVPVYTVVGNHDVEGKLERDYVRNLSPYNFSFTFGAARFVFFNNASLDVLQPENGAMKWLRSDLESGSSALTFVFLHRPPFKDATETKNYDQNPICSPLLAPRFMKLVADQGVNAVFCGHIHEYHRWERSGVPYVITGEGGERVGGGPSRYAKVRVEGARWSIVDETAGSSRKPTGPM